MALLGNNKLNSNNISATQIYANKILNIVVKHFTNNEQQGTIAKTFHWHNGKMDNKTKNELLLHIQSALDHTINQEIKRTGDGMLIDSLEISSLLNLTYKNVASHLIKAFSGNIELDELKSPIPYSVNLGEDGFHSYEDKIRHHYISRALKAKSQNAKPPVTTDLQTINQLNSEEYNKVIEKLIKLYHQAVSEYEDEVQPYIFTPGKLLHDAKDPELHPEEAKEKKEQFAILRKSLIATLAGKYQNNNPLITTFRESINTIVADINNSPNTEHTKNTNRNQEIKNTFYKTLGGMGYSEEQQKQAYDMIPVANHNNTDKLRKNVEVILSIALAIKEVETTCVIGAAYSQTAADSILNKATNNDTQVIVDDSFNKNLSNIIQSVVSKEVGRNIRGALPYSILEKVEVGIVKHVRNQVKEGLKQKGVTVNQETGNDKSDTVKAYIQNIVKDVLETKSGRKLILDAIEAGSNNRNSEDNPLTTVAKDIGNEIAKVIVQLIHKEKIPITQAHIPDSHIHKITKSNPVGQVIQGLKKKHHGMSSIDRLELYNHRGNNISR